MPETNNVGQNPALMEWREKHFHELDNCFRVEISIMNDESASARERNTAARNAASMLGALTEKSSPQQLNKAKVRIDAPAIPDANKAELESMLDEF